MYTLEDVDKEKLPQHVAIIMDGNGRWAKQRGKLRMFGHENGVESVNQTVESCAKLQIPFLTLYAFSTENWNRPKTEIDTLMRLLVNALKRELKTLNKHNIRLRAIGRIDTLPTKVHKELTEVMSQTENNSG
ncbi:MAG: polyprenyl diphosphate synthase, partial [Bacteroidota bacterium]|nr:polyprenyl diphosphate synthase [Bacteroidota bacterium]